MAEDSEGVRRIAARPKSARRRGARVRSSIGSPFLSRPLPTRERPIRNPARQGRGEAARSPTVKPGRSGQTTACRYDVQAGRVPQAIPWALKASQIRQPLGVPFARLPSLSSAARKTVYQLVAAQPSTVAAGLHLPPETTR